MKITMTHAATLALAAALWLGVTGCNERSAMSQERETQLCKAQLQKVNAALLAYRVDHKDLPNWLSDLVPKYLSDTNLLLCPITRRTGQTHSFVQLKDPKLAGAYLYEFSLAPMGGVWSAGQIKMRDFKRRQMGFVGGVVPIVRCHLHQRVLNLAFDGHVYESALGWEDNFTNVVTVETWNREKLFPELAQMNRPTPQAVPATPGLQPKDLIGKPAPDFTLPLLEGGIFDLAAHKGEEILLLDFWAGWCPPCRTAMPIIAEVERQYGDDGIKYYAVNLRETPETITRLLKNLRLDLSVPLDKDGKVALKYGVQAIPTTFVIDKEGIVTAVHIGAGPNLRSELMDSLEDLLTADSPDTNDVAQPRPSAAISARSPNARPGMIDLTAHFHSALTETWHPGSEGNDLAGLPAGVQTLEKVPFDIRGIVQLNGGGMVDMKGKAYPRRVQGIKVAGKCTRLHILHSAGWSVEEGTVVGHYILRYADGSRRQLPIVYGEDVRDWWVGSDQVVELKRAKVAWQGKTSNGSEVRVYMRMWDNPVPDREIASIDFVSTMTRCAPFLIAITTE